MSSSITITNLSVENLYLNFGSSQSFGGGEGGLRLGLLNFTEGFPVTNDRVWVKPGGYICGFVDVAPGYSEVRAIVSQTQPTGSPPMTAGAVPGWTRNSLTWNWTDGTNANLVSGAVHSLGGMQNYLLIWHKLCRTGSDFTYGGSVPFCGVTGDNSSCGGPGKPAGTGCGSGGSGSGSSSGSHGLHARELHAGKSLELTIADGAHEGIHRASPLGQATWEAVIGGIKSLITLGGCGKRLVVKTPQGDHTSSEIVQLPFRTSFEGSSFHSSKPVRVTVA